MSNQNYYKLLGIQKTATDQELKKAYYKLAKEWHPDKNKSSGAEEYFKSIKIAYETLSDPDKRRTYDFQYQPDISTKTATTKTTATDKPKTYSWENRAKSSTRSPPKTSRNSENFKSESEYFFFTSPNDSQYRPRQFKSSTRPKWNNNWTRDESENLNQQDIINDIFLMANLASPFQLLETIAIYKLFGTRGVIVENLADFITVLNQEPVSSSRLPKVNPSNKKEEKLEFEWLGDKKNSRNHKINEPESEDDFDQNTSSSYSFFNSNSSRYFDLNDRLLVCSYCFREFDNRDILDKHETVCKKLSHNLSKHKNEGPSTTSNTFRSQAGKQAPKWRSASKNTTSGASSTTKPSSFTGLKREKQRNSFFRPSKFE